MIRRTIVSIISVALLLSISLGVFRSLLSLRHEPQKNEIVRPYTAVLTAAAQKQNFHRHFYGYGTAHALQRSDVSPEVSGVIRWISPKLEAGAGVDKGEILIQLDARDLDKAVTAARAALSQAEFQLVKLELELENAKRELAIAAKDLKTSQREFSRVKGMRNSASDSLLDNQDLTTSMHEREVVKIEWQQSCARSALESTRVAMDAAGAQLAKAIDDLIRANIVAPYSGKIEVRYAHVGAYVHPGVPLFRIVDVSRVEVAISLGAAHFREVNPGSRVELRLRQEDSPAWQGKIARKGPLVEPDRTFSVYCEVAAPPLQKLIADCPIPPGAFVEARVSGPVYPHVFVLPRAALLGQHVFVVRRAGEEAFVEEIEPHIVLALSDVVLVDRGLIEGDEVVVTNLGEIAHGSRVLANPAPAVLSPGNL